MEKFWYLWASPDETQKQKVLALGPFKTREEVDSLRDRFRDWAEKFVKGWNHWSVTGGVAYATNQGAGKANMAFAEWK